MSDRQSHADTLPVTLPRVEVPVEVRYAETDQMGWVHHSRYLVWFEIARTKLCLESGYHYAEIEAMGTWLVVTGAELRYRQGARYGDTVTVVCSLTRLVSRGLTFGYEVRRGAELLVTGSTEHVWVEAASGRPCRIPEVLRPGFERLRGAEPAG